MSELGPTAQCLYRFRDCQALYEQYDMLPLPGLGTDPRLGLGTLASIRGDYVRARELAQQACQVARAPNHLHNLQTGAWQVSPMIRARMKRRIHMRKQPMLPANKTGDRWFMAYCLKELGRAAIAQHDFEAARHHLRQALAIAAEIQFTSLVLSILAASGHLFIQR